MVGKVSGVEEVELILDVSTVKKEDRRFCDKVLGPLVFPRTSMLCCDEPAIFAYAPFHGRLLFVCLDLPCLSIVYLVASSSSAMFDHVIVEFSDSCAGWIF